MTDIDLVCDGVPVRVMSGPYLENGRPSHMAVEHYTGLCRRLPELRTFAAKKLHSLYNDTWFDESIGVVDEERFTAMLVNPQIQLFDEIGAAVVYFNDSGLFAGHCVEVSIQNGTPTSAGIIG